MDTDESWSWKPEEERLGTTIKEILFDTGNVDPESYDQADILAAKCRDNRYLVDDATWFTAFRRAACEYNLEKDHKEVELWHLQRRGRYEKSSNSSVKPRKTCALPHKKKTVPLEVKAAPTEQPTSKHILPTTMASSVLTNVTPQTVVSSWRDKHQNSRAHVVIVLPAATSAKDLREGTLENENSELGCGMLWPKDMSKVERMLSHSRYNNHYTTSHPKWIALQGSFDEAIGDKSHFISKFKIKLPSKGYQFTPEHVSGHKACSIFEHKSFRFENGRKVEVPAKATLFCVFDLFIPNEVQQVGNTRSLEDDFDIYD